MIAHDEKSDEKGEWVFSVGRVYMGTTATTPLYPSFRQHRGLPRRERLLLKQV